MRRTMAVLGFVLFVTQWTLCTLGAKSVIWIAAAGVIALIAVALFPKLRKETVLLCSILVILAGCVLFYTEYAFYVRPIMALNGQRVEIYAHMSDLPRHTESSQQVELRIDSIQGEPIRGKMYLNTDELPVFAFSDGLVFSAALHNQYDSGHSGGVIIQGYCKGSNILVLSEKPTFSSRMLAVRSYVVKTLLKEVPGTYGRILASLLTGDSDLIPDDVYMTLQSCGILHLFAVSGFHLSVFSMTLLHLFSRDRVPSRVLIAAAAALVFFIMAVTGFSYSCVRAGVMIFILLAGQWIHVQSDSLNSLGFALLGIGMADPFAASDIGLQLSVLGVLCLILLAPRLSGITCRIRFRPKKLCFFVRNLLSILLITACIQIITLPVTVPIFRMFTPIAPIVNSLIFTASQFALIAAAFVVVFSLSSFFLPLLRLFGLIGGLLAKYCVFVCSVFENSSIRIRALGVRQICFWIAGTLFVGAVSIWIPMTIRKRALTISRVSAVILLACALCGAWTTVSESRITLPDVGNASGYILQSEGETALLGCGRGISPQVIGKYTSKLNVLCVPRFGVTESYSLSLMRFAMPIDIWIPPHVVSEDAQDLLSDKTSNHTDTFQIGAIQVQCYTEGDQAAAFAEVHSVSVLFLFGSGFVPDNMPHEWTQADVVCARNGLPHGWQVEKTGLVLLSVPQRRRAAVYDALCREDAFVAATAGDGDLCLRISRNGTIRLERGD